MKSSILAALFIVLTGCATTEFAALKDENTNPLQLKEMQTRKFEATDPNLVTRNVISTLQDLRFTIKGAEFSEENIGSVEASKSYVYPSALRTEDLSIEVTINPRSNKSTEVVASLASRWETIADPKMYQDFFTALSKSIFFSENEVE